MTMQRKLDIIIHSMGMPFDGETIAQRSLGGSESAAYYQARGLAARGHNVKVFTTIGEASHTDGVDYVPMGQASQTAPLGSSFEHYARHTPHDVLIIQRHPLAFQGMFASRINIWQLHDIALLRTVIPVNQMLWNIDVTTCVSEFHKKQVSDTYGIDPDTIAVVPNGVDPALYDILGYEGQVLPLTMEHLAPDCFTMLYQSRPERGLEHLVRPGGIMDQINAESYEMRTELLVCGYENTVHAMVDYYRQLKEWGQRLRNVKFIGALTKAQLAGVQRRCDLLIYPTEFEEVSCITAMEAMHAGLPLLTSDVGALKETCEESGSILVALNDGRADEETFVNEVVKLTNYKKQKNYALLREAQLLAANRKTWDLAIDQLEEVIARRLYVRSGTLLARAKHSLEHSDIKAASTLLGTSWISDPEHFLTEELSELYAFQATSETYKAHYDKHQGAYYDGPGAKAVGEDVTLSTRYRAVLQFMGQEIHEKQGMRVLDYGCAHGHYLMPLAVTFSQHTFTGVDISERAIGAAVQWANREGIRNAQFVIGSYESLVEGSKVHDFANGAAAFQDWLCPRERIVHEEIVDEVKGEIRSWTEYGEPQLFDVILAGEVVEHVPDYVELLERLRCLLKPDGLLIITTPVGRWEWSGTEAFREAREHLWHFERKDILEVCGENPVDLLYAPAGHDQAGGTLGSWVWGVRNRGYSFQPLNIQRKILEIIPARETVSACLIVKDGERTIRRCIESFIDWVDEVIVAVDESTTDRTRLVLEQLQTDFKWRSIKVVSGEEALKEGFYVARNRSIEEASCDWILWLDADEEVQQPWNLWKYLRPTQHWAYGFPQVHYACDPPQVLTTDFPCRLFRNDKDIRFYGLVHEHPEVAVGKAIPHATIRHDVQFLHCGYVDEAVRRKRFDRNLPLLIRDLKAFPERKLNKFLWLRDIAQGTVFNIERQGGAVTQLDISQAREGVQLFEEMLANHEGHSKMLLDAVQYYSQCVSVTQEGFDAELTFFMSKDPIKDLAARCNIKGKFHSTECFNRLVNSLLKEGSKNYESKYL